MMKRVVGFLLGIILYSVLLKGQSCTNELTIAETDSLTRLVGYQKEFDSLLYSAALLALKNYPELYQSKIVFRSKKLKTLMAARPSPDFIFKKKKNRTYQILINTKQSEADVIRNMSICAQTGIIGHEYAHIVAYQKKNNLKMLAFGVKYLFSKREIERETDQLTIDRGLGNELLQFNLHVKDCKHVTEKYLNNKERNYLSVAEINKIINNTL